MSSNRGSRPFLTAAVGGVLVLLGGCASRGVGAPTGSATGTSSVPLASATPWPLSATELATALPSGNELPGYSVNAKPELKTDGGPERQGVRPAACRPLEDAHDGLSATAAASARVSISASVFAPPDESITFTSHRPGGAASDLASIEKALGTCPSLSFRNRYGAWIRTDVNRVRDRVSAGDASVSFRMHFVMDIGGSKMDTYRLVTVVRSGEATMTVVSDSSVGSQLSAAKKRTFSPKLDQTLLEREANALRGAQHS